MGNYFIVRKKAEFQTSRWSGGSTTQTVSVSGRQQLQRRKFSMPYQQCCSRSGQVGFYQSAGGKEIPQYL